jgi:hypothetical protein
MKHIAIPQALINEQNRLISLKYYPRTAEDQALYDAAVAANTQALSAFGDVAMTADEEAAFIADQAAAQASILVSSLKEKAQAALDKTDMVALRCIKSGTSFPEEWMKYVSALRDIMSNGTGTIPVQPQYPEGT